ncbi:MAG TPA: metal-dependent hydrolase [Eudoraea sp.]|nr:metal-dependent hydrolase [Eudoraea sp.]
MKITFLGHATLQVSFGEYKLLVDPFITGNEQASGKIDIQDLDPHYILVTHAHQDHILDVEAIAKSCNATIVSNYEVATYFGNKGHKVHPMNHGGNWKFDFGTLKYTNAIHTSSFPDGSYGGQPGGFILSADGKQVYIAGDTALTSDMKLIPMTHSLDLAVLPIGDNFTMGIDDAVLASDFIECSRILGYHYDTFGYIKIDHEKALTAFEKAGKQLHLLNIGESITV